MKPTFEYNYKSILTAPAKALKAKKIFLASCGLLLAILFYAGFSYLAVHVDDLFTNHSQAAFEGIPILEIILMPVDFSISIWAILTHLTGIFLAVLSIMLGMLACSSCDFEELRGNPFFSVTDAIKFTISRTPQLLISIFAIALFIGLILLLGILVGLITRIPYAGELLYALFFLFPNFIIAIFTVLIIFVFFTSFIIMPITVAADRNRESFNSILESFLTITRHPFRWGIYTAFTLIAAKVCGFIYAFFSYKAIQLIQETASIGGGDKIHELMASGFSNLPLDSEIVKFTFTLFPDYNISVNLSTIFADGPETIAGYILSVMLFLIFVSIWGYMLSVVATGQAYSFAIIKYVRDGHKIGDEDSLFYEEEWANPLMDDDNKPKENDA